MSPETSDELLMLAFKKGDARAFETLVRRHRAPVFNFILRFTGNRARAEDILQDTWIKVVRSSSEYEPKARFKTWLYTIARNLCVDSARKESYRAAESLEGEGRPGEEGSGPTAAQRVNDDGAAQPDRHAYNREVRPLLEEAVTRLPEEQREVFLLREQSGLSFKEIAEATGTPENTVKSRMRYALDALRKNLSAAGVEGDLAEGGRTVA